MEYEKEIKCHLCKGKAVLRSREMKFNNGDITFKDSPYYECSKCKEEFATSEQMYELNDKIHAKFAFRRPIINAGRSLAITLPSDIVKEYKLDKGQEVRIIPQNSKKILIQL